MSKKDYVGAEERTLKALDDKAYREYILDKYTQEECYDAIQSVGELKFNFVRGKKVVYTPALSTYLEGTCTASNILRLFHSHYLEFMLDGTEKSTSATGSKVHWTPKGICRLSFLLVRCPKALRLKKYLIDNV